MADQNITELPIKTNTGVASTDYMLGIDSAEGYQILVRDVAKYIVENYNGSSLAGSAQTPKSAIDALNNKTVSGTAIENGTDLNTLTVPGQYFCNNITIAQSLVNCPLSAPFRMIVLYSNGTQSTRVIQIIIQYVADSIWTRSVTNGTGTEWIKQPTRAEITDLNSNRLSINVSSANPVSVPFWRYNVALVSGLAQGIGSVSLLVKSTASTFSVTDIASSKAFSSTILTFEYNDSARELTITSTYSTVSKLMFIYLYKDV